MVRVHPDPPVEGRRRLARILATTGNRTGGVAQLGEHLLCKQGVIGSIPFTSTTIVGGPGGPVGPAAGSQNRAQSGRGA